MTRRRTKPSPWAGSRRRRAPFGLTVAAVAGTAFVGAYYWPWASSVAVTGAHLTPAEVSTEAGARTPRPGDFECRVSSITDGDTLRCSDGTKIRLHAVAAREADETCSPGHPCPTASAASATSMLRSLASGRTLSCQRTGSSYDRVTAICWTPEGREINCAMVRSGVALVWPRFNREQPLCRA